MKPIIKWSGGKAKEIKYFKRHYPESFKRFIEPFVGGGAVFFDLEHDDNVINDIHSDLTNFYYQLKLGNADKIYQLMSYYENNEKDYYFIRDEFKPNNEIERAFVFFYLRKTCFRGMLRYNKKGKFNIPYGRYKTFDYEILKEKKYEKLLKNTVILQGDVQNVFEQYDNEENFVFLDPPYDSKFTDYGYCVYDRKKQYELAEMFKSTKNKCLMVIGETDFINDLYKGYIVEKYHKKYAFKIYEGRVGNEIDNYHLIIKNY